MKKMKFHIIDNLTNNQVHEGKYPAVHTTYEARKAGITIRWIAPISDGLTLGVDNLSTLVAEDEGSLWICQSLEDLPHPASIKVVWRKEEEPKEVTHDSTHDR